VYVDLFHAAEKEPVYPLGMDQNSAPDKTGWFIQMGLIKNGVYTTLCQCQLQNCKKIIMWVNPTL